MTRFRIFGGRHVHRRSGVPPVTSPGVPAARNRTVGTWPTPPLANDPSARHRVARPVSLRTTVTAAVVVGGALAVTVPAVVISTQPSDPAPDPSRLLQLAADDAGTPIAEPAMLPAVDHAAALPPELEVAGLVKAAGLAARAENGQPRAAQPAARCDSDVDRLGEVKPWARTAARFLVCLYDERGVGGVNRQVGPSDSLTVDLLVAGKHTGDRIASCALANRKELGIDSVMWRQRANNGDGWERMPDRGGDTANHRDHVRISFERSAPDGDPLARRCR